MGRLVASLPGLVLVASLACGGGSSGGSPPPATRTLSLLAVTPADQTLAAGATLQLTATGTYSDGSTTDLTTEATWSSSDLAVATMSGRTATGVAAGTTRIRATLGAVSGETGLTVTVPKTLTRIAVAPADSTLGVGAMQDYTATGTYSDATTGDVTGQVTWTSSSTAVATMAGRTATGVAAGTTRVRATLGAVWGDTGLTVIAGAFVAMRIDPGLPVVGVGETLPLRCYARTAAGAEVPVLASWSTSDGTVASVGAASGAVTGVKVGAATLTAHHPELPAVSVTVTVSATHLERVAMAGLQPVHLAVGNRGAVALDGFYSDGSEADVTELARWTSDAPGVVAVSDLPGSKGVLDARSPGTAHVTGAVGGLAASATVHVAPGALAFVNVEIPVPLPAAQGVQLRATAVYLDGRTEDVTALAAWASSDGAVATVSAGRVTAVAAGAAIVSATYGGVIGRAPVAVLGPDVSRIAFLYPTLILEWGERLWSLAFEVTYADSTTAHTSHGVGVAVADPGILRGDWDPAQLLTVWRAVGVGSTDLVASFAGLAATATVTVRAPAGLGLEISPSLPAQATVQAVARTRVGYSGVDVTDLVTWSSSDPAAVAVTDATPKGVVTTGSSGGATVTAAGGGVSASLDVTVRAALARLTLTPAGAVATVQQPVPFAVLAVLVDDSVLDVTTSATWKVADPCWAEGRSPVRVGSYSPASCVVTATFAGSVAQQLVTFLAPPDPRPTRLVILPEPDPAVGGYGLPLDTTVRFRAQAFFPTPWGGTTARPVTASWRVSRGAIGTFSDLEGHDGELTTGSVPGYGDIEAFILVSADEAVGATAHVGISTVGDLEIVPAWVGSLDVGSTGQAPVFARFHDQVGGLIKVDVTPFATLRTLEPALAAVRAPGVVTGLRPGRANLEASFAGWRAGREFAVATPAIGAVRLSPSAPIDGAVPLPLGQTSMFRAWARIGADPMNEVEVTDVATWSSSDPTLVEVGPRGAVWARALTAIPVGVTASLGGRSGTTPVTVPAATERGRLELELARLRLPVGAVTWIGARARERSVSGLVTVASTAPAVASATVGYGSWGRAVVTPSVALAAAPGALGAAAIEVRALSPGTTLVSATLHGEEAYAVVTVEDFPYQLGLDWDRSALQVLRVGEAVPVAAVGLDPVGHGVFDPSGIPGFTVDSTAPAVVAVDGGALRALAPGAAVVTVTTPTGQTASESAGVLPGAPVALEPTHLALALPAGAFEAVRVFATYPDGVERDLTRAATWATTDAAVAEVDPQRPGLVRARGPGSATITATAGGRSTEIAVTVF